MVERLDARRGADRRRADQGLASRQNSAPATGGAPPNGQKFFGSFFKKEQSFSSLPMPLAPLAVQQQWRRVGRRVQEGSVIF
jgi:hypothetical protein